MKKKIFSYILAAVCTAAAFSCNLAPEVEIDDPALERDVVLTATIDDGPATRAVSVTGEAITATWVVGDVLHLVYNGKVVTSLFVTDISGNKATASGKVKGAYPANTSFTLFYNYTSHNYAGQTGLAGSAAQSAYLLADNVKISKQNNKTLTLGTAVMKYQQAFAELQFRYGPDLIPVRKLEITGSDKFVVSRTLTPNGLYSEYSDRFTVTTAADGGLTKVFFAVSDETTANVDYTFTVTGIDNRLYDAHVKAGTRFSNGSYVSGEWILEKKENGDVTVTTPAVATGLVYDARPHDLLQGSVAMIDNVSGQAGPGAEVQYFVRYFEPGVIADTSVPAADAAGWSTDLPQGTEPGSYYIYYKVVGGQYYEDVAPAQLGSAPVVIDKRSISVTAPSAIAGLKYTGSAQSLVNAGTITDAASEEFDPGLAMEYFVIFKAPGAAAPETTEYPDGTEATGWGTAIPRGTNAGTYYVWYRVKGSDHFYGLVNTDHAEIVAGPVAVPIEAAEAVVGNPVPIQNLVYNGSEQQLVLPADASQGCTVYYYVSEEQTFVPVAGDTPNPAADAWSTEVPKQKNAGTYYIWTKVVEPEGSSNYTDAPGISAAAVVATIAKADVTVTAPTLVANWTYDGQSHELLATLGTVTYKDKNNANQNALEDNDFRAQLLYKVNSGEWVETPTNPTAVNAGNYVVQYKVDGGRNFKSVVATTIGTVVVAKASPITPTPSTLSEFTPATAAAGWAYDGTAKPLLSAAATVTGDGCSVVYKVTDSSTAPAVTSTGWSSTIPTETNAGTYYVWTKVVCTGTPQNFNDEVYSTPAVVTVTKGTTAITIVNATKSFTYNGSAQVLVSTADYTVSRATSEDTQVVQYATGTSTAPGSSWTNIAPSATNVADTPVYVWIKVLESAHYSEQVSESPITATIDPVSPVINATLSDDIAYDNNDHPLVTSASITPNFGTLQFNVGSSDDASALDAGSWSTDIPQKSAIGTYYVFARVVGDGSNISNVGPTCLGYVTISGTAPTLTTDPTVNDAVLTYDGTPKQLLSAGGSTSDGTLSYKAIKSDTTPAKPGVNSDGWVDDYASLTMTDAGNYYIYVKITGDSSHSDAVFGPYGPKEILKAAATLTCSSDPMSFTTSQGAGSTLERTGVSCTGGTISVVSATEANCTASFSESTITVTRVKTDAFTDSAITVSVTPDSNHYWDTANNVTFNVSAIKWSSLSGGDFSGFNHNEGNEQNNW